MKQIAVMVFFVAIFFFTVSTGYTQALIYNKCPDSARVYSISGDEISTIEEDLCDNEEVEIYTSQYVIANWTRESYPPFQNEEDPVIEGVQPVSYTHLTLPTN